MVGTQMDQLTCMVELPITASSRNVTLVQSKSNDPAQPSHPGQSGIPWQALERQVGP